MMREKILADLKDLILTVRDKGQELKEPHLFGLWSAKLLMVKDAANAVSEEDRNWIDGELQEWFEKEVNSKLNDAQKKLLEERFTS